MSKTDDTDMTDDTDSTDNNDSASAEVEEIRVTACRHPKPEPGGVWHPMTGLIVYALPDERPEPREWTDDCGQHHRVVALQPTRYYRLAERGNVRRIYAREHYVDGQLVETLSPADAWPEQYRGETIFKRHEAADGGSI